MIFILLLVVVVVAFILLIKQKEKVTASDILKQRKKLSQQYFCNEGAFDVKGYKDEFTINKNGCIEFLVKNGQIVASRDLRVGKEFVYYGGEKNGNN